MRNIVAIGLILLPFIHAYTQAHNNRFFQLFGQADSFCDSSKDIRIVLLGQTFLYNLQTNLSDPQVSAYLQFLQSLKATVLFANLEVAINGTYAQQNNATITNPAGTHIGPDGILDILQQNFTINAVATSNNHFTDFSPAGTISGLMELKKRGIPNTGAGYNRTQSQIPTYVAHSNGKKIGITGVVSATTIFPANDTTPGVNYFTMINGTNGYPNTTEQQWQYTESTQACQNSDIVINYHHNHYYNNTWTIDPWWQTFAHSMIDAGGSIYLSNGAENIRGIEIYKGSIIAYSNGNLIFETQTHASVMNQEGFILDTCWDGTNTLLKGARVIPTLITNGTSTPGSAAWNASHGLPTLSSGAQALSTLTKLQNLSAAFNTTILIDNVTLIGNIQVGNFTPPDKSYGCLRNQDTTQLSGSTALVWSQSVVFLSLFANLLVKLLDK